MTTSTPPESTTSAASMSRRRMAVITILLSGFTAFGPLSMDLYLPAFPQLADQFGVGQGAVQLTLTADVIGLVLGQLVIGPLSDAHGRRRLLIGSTLVCALASVLCALAPTAGLLTVWRFIQGAAGGGGIVLARAVAADLTSGVSAARLFSLFMTLSSLAPIAAPILGGVLLTWTGSWQPMFYLLAAISLVLAVASWRVVPETLSADRRHTGGIRATGRAFAALARDRVFAGYALTVAFAYASLFGYIAGSSFVLQDLFGLSPAGFSLVFALNAGAAVGLGLLNARLVRRIPVRRLLMIGLVGSTAAAVLMVIGVVATRPGTTVGLLAVLVPLLIVVGTRGLVSANATVLGVERATAAGSASAVLGACMFTGGVVITPFLALGAGSAVPMAAVVAGGAIAALLSTALLTRGRPVTGARP